MGQSADVINLCHNTRYAVHSRDISSYQETAADRQEIVLQKRRSLLVLCLQWMDQLANSLDGYKTAIRQNRDASLPQHCCMVLGRPVVTESSCSSKVNTGIAQLDDGCVVVDALSSCPRNSPILTVHRLRRFWFRKDCLKRSNDSI